MRQPKWHLPAMGWDTAGEEGALLALGTGLPELKPGEGARVAAGAAAEPAAGRLVGEAAAAAEGPAPWDIIRGLSSDCWTIFTPSGLVQADSRVRAL